MSCAKLHASFEKNKSVDKLVVVLILSDWPINVLQDIFLVPMDGFLV